MSDKKLQEEKLSDNTESEQKTEATPETTKEEVKALAVEESIETPENTSEEKTEEAKEEKTEEVVKEKSEGPANTEKSDEETHEDDEEEVTSSDDHHKEEVHEDPEVKDYHSLSKEELITELAGLLKSKPVQQIKHDVEEIRSEFNAKFNEELEHQKEEFLASGGNIIDFHYTTPVKKNFNSLYFDYKEKRNEYYKNLKKDLRANLEIRQALIEELKGLLNAEENINTTYKHFKDIQERWHTAGPIPRDKYNLIWNTYRHHVENFYDFLHLNREFRDLDFKHNLEQKLKLITRAEELQQEEDISKSIS